MNNVIYAFILSGLAGFSTLLGTFIIFFKNKSEKVISYALAFASGVMITVSITDLLPNSYTLLNNKYYPIFSILLILLFANIGIIIGNLFDKKLIIKESSNIKNKKLYRVGVMSMLAIIIHNIPEGIATFITSTSNLSLGITLSIAIALHNIPEGISISLPIYYSTNNIKKAFFYTFISGISELIGSLLSFLILSRFINDSIMAYLYSFIAGMMLYISFNELLPTSVKYNKRRVGIVLSIIIGSFIMILSHILI